MTHRTRDRHEDADALTQPRAPIRLVVDNLRSAFNVGSIIRTSEAARIEHLHLCGITPRPPHRQLTRTALGATRYVSWSHHPDAAAVLGDLRDSGVQTLALELTPDAVPYVDVPLRAPVAVVVGHEVLGVSDAALAQCETTIQIPMFGVKNSLNVATSAGIVLFEFRRRLAIRSEPAGRDCT